MMTVCRKLSSKVRKNGSVLDLFMESTDRRQVVFEI